MGRSHLFSLRIQVVLLLAVLLGLPMTVIGYTYYSSMMNSLEEIERDHAYSASDAAHKLTDKIGKSLLDSVITNAHWEDYWKAVETKDLAWIEKNVNVSTSVIPNVNFASTIGLNGTVLSQSGDVPEFTGKLGYPELLERLGKEDVFSGFVSTGQGLAVLGVAKVTDETEKAKPQALLVFGRFIDAEALEEIKETLYVDVALLPKKGAVLGTRDDAADVLQAHLNKAEADPGYRAFQSRSLDGELVSEVMTPFLDINGKPLGVMYVGSPSETSSQVSAKIQMLSLLVGGVLLLLVVLLAVIFQLRVLKPLRQFARLLGDVAAGDLTKDIAAAHVRRRDEVGLIAGSLQSMLRQFKTIVAQIRETTDQVAASADRLTSSAEATVQASHQIVAEMQGVADGAAAQTSGAEQGARSMQEMSAGIHQVSERSSRVADVSQQAAADAEAGNVLIQEADKQMASISEAVARSSEVVKRLGKHSEEIGLIVDIIARIAAQTNILALNANIEAARAGEHGKGFAVVAAEVRKLAAQSEEATKQIEELVGSMQADTADVIGAIERGTREASDGTVVILRAGDAFQKIYESVRRISADMQDVSAVAEEMSASSEELSASVEESAAIAKRSAEHTDEIVAITEEQLAAMEGVSQSMATLNQLAQSLKQEVSLFRIVR
ncbi:methyl-accepting chemotaxis protein [Paenibacillus sp. MBLB4367]|uniref:methyl-accepting chemotaxis protein n=1 Tax=Paenibacillus sp. MBLB4367 TaxID=3384767 RepID=UPI003908073B